MKYEYNRIENIELAGKDYTFEVSYDTAVFNVDVSYELANEVMVCFDNVNHVQGLNGYYNRKEPEFNSVRPVTKTSRRSKF